MKRVIGSSIRVNLSPYRLNKTKRQEAEMEVAELKMLRFSLGVTRMDKIRNEYIRGTAQVGKFGEKTREARLEKENPLWRPLMGKAERRRRRRIV